MVDYFTLIDTMWVEDYFQLGEYHDTILSIGGRTLTRHLKWDTAEVITYSYLILSYLS